MWIRLLGFLSLTWFFWNYLPEAKDCLDLMVETEHIELLQKLICAQSKAGNSEILFSFRQLGWSHFIVFSGFHLGLLLQSLKWPILHLPLFFICLALLKLQNFPIPLILAMSYRLIYKVNLYWNLKAKSLSILLYSMIVCLFFLNEKGDLYSLVFSSSAWCILVCYGKKLPSSIKAVFIPLFFVFYELSTNHLSILGITIQLFFSKTMAFGLVILATISLTQWNSNLITVLLVGLNNLLQWLINFDIHLEGLSLFSSFLILFLLPLKLPSLGGRQ